MLAVAQIANITRDVTEPPLSVSLPLASFVDPTIGPAAAADRTPVATATTSDSAVTITILFILASILPP